MALAERAGRRRVLVATAEPLDGEMRARIARHRADRGAGWRTLEEPLVPGRALADIERGGEADVVVIDCLTLWLSNLVHRERDADEAIAALLDAIGGTTLPLVLVSNELGFGLVPETPLGRRFRDVHGRLNQRMAGACERVELVVAGLPPSLRESAGVS